MTSRWMTLLFAMGVGLGYAVEQAESKHLNPAEQAAAAAATGLPYSGRYQPVAAELKRLGVVVLMNSKLCKKEPALGWYTGDNNRIHLCVDQIRVYSFDQADYQDQLDRALAHEAAHAAQGCQTRRRGITYLGITAAKLYALSASQQNEINLSRSTGTYPMAPSLAWRHEAEAQYLEDKPEEVVRYLRQYC